MPPAPKEVGTLSRGGGGAGFAMRKWPLPTVSKLSNERYTSSKYSEVIVFTPHPPQGGEKEVTFSRWEKLFIYIACGSVDGLAHVVRVGKTVGQALGRDC